MTKLIESPILDPIPVSDEQIRSARIVIAGRARDRDDAALLLDALGLDGREHVDPILARYLAGETYPQIARAVGLSERACWDRVAHSGVPMRKPEPAQCGTRPGYMRHLDRGEPTCEPCRAANRAAVARNKARRKQAA